MRREQNYTMMEQKEEQTLDRMDKLFHLERSKRIMEYRKELAWQKIRRSDSRTKALEDRKSQLLEERRRLRDMCAPLPLRGLEQFKAAQCTLERFRTVSRWSELL
jgi:hypothetical protein